MSQFRPPHPHRGDSQGQANLYSCMYIHIYSIHSIYIYIHFYALELLIQPSLDSYLHKQTIYFTFYTASSIYLSIYLHTHTHIYIYIYIYITQHLKDHILNVFDFQQRCCLHIVITTDVKQWNTNTMTWCDMVTLSAVTTSS